MGSVTTASRVCRSIALLGLWDRNLVGLCPRLSRLQWSLSATSSSMYRPARILRRSHADLASPKRGTVTMRGSAAGTRRGCDSSTFVATTAGRVCSFPTARHRQWRLGWAAQIPEDYFLLLADAGVNGVSVPWGIVTARTVASMVERGGFSLPLEVTSPVTIRRGDPVARLILLHRDSLQARAHWPGAESGNEEGDSDKYD